MNPFNNKICTDFRTKTLRLIQFGIIYFVIFLFYISTSSCKKFLDIDSPYTSINAQNVYASDATAISVLTGIYAQLSSGAGITTNAAFGGGTSISLLCGLSADELTLFNSVTSLSQIAYYKNTLITNNIQSIGSEFWSACYKYIYQCNDAIEGLTMSTKVTPNVRQQLIGEAKYLRAFFYFHLLNLYGSAPLATGTNYTENAQLSRAPVSAIYHQIISDLNDAKAFLNPVYVDATVLKSTTERVRPNKGVAAAMLARVHLYMGNFANAEVSASEVINDASTYVLSSLGNVFARNSTEAIWQLQPVNSGYNTEDGRLFIISAAGPSSINPVYLSNQLVSSFEINDQRKINWTKSVSIGPTVHTFPFKYKINTLNSPVTEFLMMLRLGETYLIRAEARAKQNNLAGAISDLDKIRQRSGLTLISVTNPGISQTALVDVILHEKQVELFTEWGHRWMDLKRTNSVDAVMSNAAPSKGTSWMSYQQLYPIPFADILRNANLIQNNGY